MGLVGVAKKGWQDREREEVFFEAWKGGGGRGAGEEEVGGCRSSEEREVIFVNCHGASRRHGTDSENGLLCGVCFVVL